MSRKSCADAHGKRPKGGEVKLRMLAPSQLGSVIFGCTNTTINECLSKKLFGLPSRHMVYVQNIRKEMPLFLFNYSDKKLHGIYEAISDGKKNIDATAWTLHSTGKTLYPAQVSACIRLQCNPLSEDLFKPVIKDNYYTGNYGQNNHFMFELDHQQIHELIMLFCGPPHPPATCKFDDTKDLSPVFPPKDSMVLGQGENVQIRKQIQFSDNDLKFQEYSGSRQLSCYESEQNVESCLLSGMNNAEPAEGYKDDPFFSYSEPSSCAGSAAIGPCGHLIPEELSLEEKLSVFLPNPNNSSKGGTLCEKMDLQGSSVISTCSLEDVAESASLKFPKKEAKCHSPVSRNQNMITQSQNDPPCQDDKFQRTRTNGSNQDTDGTMTGEDHKADEQEMEQSGHLHSSSDTELHTFHQTKIQHLFASLSQIRKEHLELKELIKEACNEQHYEFQTAHKILQNLKMKISSEVSSLRTDVSQLQEQMRKLRLQKEEPNVEKDYATSDNPIRCSIDMYTSGYNIYIIGGCDGHQWLRTMDIFCPEVNELRPAPSMLVDIARPCHAASAFDGFIYVFGGGYGKLWYDTVEVFDQRNNYWSLGTPMNLKRSCLAGASVSQGIIALGGENEQGPLSDVELYDACTGKWLEYRKMLEKRSNAAAVELCGAVYSLGGFDGSQYLRTVEQLDPRHGSWRGIASMNTPRGGLSAAIFNGKIYALGGFDGYSFLNTVEVFDPRANKWEKSDSMNTQQFYGAAAAVGDTLYLFGGLRDRKSYVEHMECYQEGVGWKLLGPSPMGKRCYVSAVVL